MKKLALILALVQIALCFAGCGKAPEPTEPPETTIPAFSDQLQNGQEAYFDIVSMQILWNYGDIEAPAGDTVLFSCTLENGDTVVMAISKQQLADQFDNTVDLSDFKFSVRNATFTEKIRIVGKVTLLPNRSEAAEEYTKALTFTSTDPAMVKANAQWTPAQIPFSEDCPLQMPAYVQIVSAYPKYQFTSSINPLKPSWLLCECKTEDGKVVYIHISVEDYGLYFKPYNGDIAHPAFFTSPVTIYGTTINPQGYFEEAQTTPTTALGLAFQKADLVQMYKANAARLDPQPFSQDVLCTAQVYATIKHIIPKYMITTHSDISLNPTPEIALLCEATLENGSKIWLYMLAQDYIDNFEENASFNPWTGTYECHGVSYIFNGKQVAGFANLGAYISDTVPSQLQDSILLHYIPQA